MTDEDFALALQLQNQFFEEQEDPQATQISHQKDGKPMSLVDPFWELTDPNPDMRALFLEFNEKYFWGRLAGVEVKWSSRMTLCAGLCRYEGRGGLCSISLSVPLLKLRPRKDLVETLLHEMIHAYLFVTDNNKDHDGHGPEFHKHMYRLNNETGTNITVYHNFHDEVDLYKQHWWRCNGPCQNRKPYFGYVKRSMNRAPSKNDTWWAEHQRSCGGTYTKIKEPEGYGKKKTKSEKGESNTDKESKPVKSGVKSMDIRIFGGEGKLLGKPSLNAGGSDKPVDNRDKHKTIPTATITSGVLSRSDSDSKLGAPDRNKKQNSVTDLRKTSKDKHETDQLPGAITPTQGVKNKPVSQGGNVPFSKVKKKSIPVLDFSDSDDDDELLAAVSGVDTDTVFIDTPNTNTTAIMDDNDNDLNNLKEDTTRLNDKHDPSSIDTNDEVDPNDVKSMLRKVWGQKQIDHNKKSHLLNSNNTSSHIAKKRQPLDSNVDQNVPNKRLKLDNNEISGKEGSGINKGLIHNGKVSIKNMSDKSVNDGAANIKSNGVKVTSPIEKMFDKMRNKQKPDIVPSSQSGKDSVIDKPRCDRDETPTVIISDETSLCPVCNNHVPVSTINDHLDLCLTLKAIS